MKLYGHPVSTCTRKVLTVLAEKGHKADFVLVDLMKREQKSPEHLARHPFGVVPVLEDDGVRLYESRAIARYLDRRLDGTPLTPTDARAYGQMEQWISVEQSYFTPRAMVLIMAKLFGVPTEQSAKDAARKDLGHALDVADKALAGQEFLAGSSFSLADVCWMPYVEYLFASDGGDLVTARSNVNAWWKRVSGRPSWQTASGKRS